MRAVEDELGLPWLVDEGDPSWEMVGKLWRAGYHYIVLPASLITGGGVLGLNAEVLTGNLKALPPDEAQRGQRLRQCLEVLGG